MALLGTGLLSLIALACAVWVIYDVAANQKKMSTLKKVIWIVLAIVLSILTAIIYYLAVKK